MVVVAMAMVIRTRRKSKYNDYHHQQHHDDESRSRRRRRIVGRRRRMRTRMEVEGPSADDQPHRRSDGSQDERVQLARRQRAELQEPDRSGAMEPGEGGAGALQLARPVPPTKGRRMEWHHMRAWGCPLPTSVFIQRATARTRAATVTVDWRPGARLACARCGPPAGPSTEERRLLPSLFWQDTPFACLMERRRRVGSRRCTASKEQALQRSERPGAPAWVQAARGHGGRPELGSRPGSRRRSGGRSSPTTCPGSWAGAWPDGCLTWLTSSAEWNGGQRSNVRAACPGPAGKSCSRQG